MIVVVYQENSEMDIIIVPELRKILSNLLICYHNSMQCFRLRLCRRVYDH